MNILIVGATGSLGRVVTKELLEETNNQLSLFARTANRLSVEERTRTLVGSVYDEEELKKALEGQDMVFVALSGDLPSMAQKIVEGMKETGVRRIIFVSSYGIYGEIAGKEGYLPSVLESYRQAADIIEESGLDYTILRPAWFDNGSDREYVLTPRGKMVEGHDISRIAIADFVLNISKTPEKYMKENLAITR